MLTVYLLLAYTQSLDSPFYARNTQHHSKLQKKQNGARFVSVAENETVRINECAVPENSLNGNAKTISRLGRYPPLFTSTSVNNC